MDFHPFWLLHNTFFCPQFIFKCLHLELTLWIWNLQSLAPHILYLICLVGKPSLSALAGLTSLQWRLNEAGIFCLCCSWGTLKKSTDALGCVIELIEKEQPLIAPDFNYSSALVANSCKGKKKFTIDFCLCWGNRKKFMPSLLLIFPPQASASRSRTGA